MQIGLGKCPACRESLSYEARLCPHCGQPFDRYGSFGGYLLAMEREQERREAERERIRRQESLNRLLFVLVLIVVVVIVIAAFLLFHNSGSVVLGTTGLDAGSAVPTPTPAVTAKNTIQHYYDDVNSQNYPVAYYMWDKQGESLAEFQSGYSNTKHDGLAFGDIVSQADGTVKVNVTIYATESTASGGTRLSTYKGYYIVGKRGNEWKILSGILNRA